jgi:hypothetical protein
VKRREFLECCGLLAASVCYPLTSAAAAARAADNSPGAETDIDILIVGGGLGGCAAALAATRTGARVVLAEPTDWIGGQLTQQAVPPDEHAWVETKGCTRTYRELRTRIRDYYRRNYPLTDSARAEQRLNPGNGSVSRLCHEPRVALAALDEMLAASISRGRLTLLLNTHPTTAVVAGDRVQAVRLTTSDGRELWVKARFFIDATEQGDLLPLTGTEYVVGAESQQQTGEPHAAVEADPSNVQALTWCFAIDHLDGEDHMIERPAQYDFWRDYVPDLSPPWSGKLLDLSYSSPRTLEPKKLAFVPPTKTAPAARTPDLNLWLYRRIIDPSNFAPGTYASGITIVNWPQNDYLLGNLITGDAQQIDSHREGARQLSLSLLYWLQTEVPRPDGGSGWKGLRLRGDIVGTADGLAKFPYIRESRRIEAEFTILEQHIAREARSKVVGKTAGELTAASFDDSVGIGYYHLDLHPSCGGDNYIDMASLPFQIPLGALIPRRMDNLIPACKNIGTTHISNGCYRLHPVEWTIGEAAGALAAFALAQLKSPRAIRNHQATLRDFQQMLQKQGFELQWS